MSYRIESIELFVREMPPDRMSFSIGKKEDSGKAAAPKKRRPRAILLTRMKISSDDGRTAMGCSGDRPSFGWLDKRLGKTPDEKLTLLLDLVEMGKDVYLKVGKKFETPFDLWLEAEAEVKKRGREKDAEDLMASFASALFERALIDAFCQIEEASFAMMVQGDRLGIDAGKVHPQLEGRKIGVLFPRVPTASFAIRHTIGLSDPIDDGDWPEGKRVNDGEPETLREYIERDGLTYFKIKIAGDPDGDLERLKAIWNRAILPYSHSPTITLDGNEAYSDIAAFARFVDRFEAEVPEMFVHTSFIEQPLTRALTLDPETTKWVRTIGAKKPLVIDEADGSTDAFRIAFGIGYSGCSHKNCKGVFKSLLNYALCEHFETTTGRPAFLSGEDLSNMPLVPLHQDFAALGVLGLTHCERNGHHYAFGLSHLTEKEKANLLEDHPWLYVERDGEWFLNIDRGSVYTTNSVFRGFGSRSQPEWEALTPFAEWRAKENA